MGRSTKKSTSSGADKLSRTTKVRMSEYYHDLLWHGVGERVQKILLWGGHCNDPNLVHLPFAMHHPRVCLGLANILNDHLYAKFGGKKKLYPSLFPLFATLFDFQGSLIHTSTT